MPWPSASTPIPDLPQTCVCSQPYSLDHSQICKRGGFIHMRHDDPISLLGLAAKGVFRDVEVEPHLTQLNGEQMAMASANISDEARSDLRIRSFWRPMRNAFFDLRVYYPFAPSYRSDSPEKLYKRFAADKKREYEQRIRNVEDGDFTPLIMSSSGGMGPEMQTFLKHLCRQIALKRNEPYAKVMRVMRCKLAFQMMHSAIVCLRGSRSLRNSHSVLRDPLQELAIAAADVCV